MSRSLVYVPACAFTRLPADDPEHKLRTSSAIDFFHPRGWRPRPAFGSIFSACSAKRSLTHSANLKRRNRERLFTFHARITLSSKGATTMRDKMKFTLSALIWAAVLLASYAVTAHAQSGTTNHVNDNARRRGFSLSANNNPSAVLGDGTVGKIPKWSYLAPNGNSVLGDSVITELGGNIGIDVANPASRLTVKGMIETTLGGYKFPDGTVQTTAAVGGLQSIFHDATLTGNGTNGSPLGVAAPLFLSSSTAIEGTLNAINTVGIAVRATGYFGGSYNRGGDTDDIVGGYGAGGQGGMSISARGGPGLQGGGGGSVNSAGGYGVIAIGGPSINSGGGEALLALGGLGKFGRGQAALVFGGV